MSLLKKHPCTQLYGEPPIQLEYCDFARNAELVSVQKTTEMISVRNDKGQLIHKPKDVIMLNMVPPKGTPWAKEESDANNHVLIYNPKTQKAYPVTKENFEKHYKVGWFKRMQTEETVNDPRIDNEAPKGVKTDKSPKAEEKKPKKAKKASKPKKAKKAKKKN